MTDSTIRVGLFATCLVDLFRPETGFAAAKLLTGAGCRLAVPADQTCCGQPAYNGGDFDSASALARRVVEQFADCDYLVAPSGSCAAMIRRHYPDLLADDPAYGGRARELADRTWELTAFLADVLGWRPDRAHFPRTVTYHDGCSGLRDLKVREQPRSLMQGIGGLELRELPGADICCGFGGTFCVKYPDISDALTGDKVADIEGTGAEVVAAGELGCLLNIAGRLRRAGSAVEARHIAEILAGDTDGPPLVANPLPPTDTQEP